MTTKIKLGILALTTSLLLILMGYVASAESGFSPTAPVSLYSPALAQSSDPPAQEILILNDDL